MSRWPHFVFAFHDREELGPRILAAGNGIETIMQGYPWLERGDILACPACAHRSAAHEPIGKRLP